ncbi:MAG TPA: hypothetical protein VLZ81_16950 [Blastocatellia bacterium]|nr:hypothetical protein [Blastocatellia bacterium]
MQKGLEILRSAAGEIPEREFFGDGEITVHREGYSRSRHILLRNGEQLAKLRWYGMRRAVYEAEDVKFEINVGALQKRISVMTPEGSESHLIERSRANPRSEDLRAEMAEGDNFCFIRSWSSRFRSQASLIVHKEFYTSTLLVFQYDVARRTQTTVKIAVNPVMKWESKFAHRLLALGVCRIILERRHSGAHPLKQKERSAHFVSSARARERRKLH